MHATREEVAMKSNSKIAAAVIGSFVLGIGAGIEGVEQK